MVSVDTTTPNLNVSSSDSKTEKTFYSAPPDPPLFKKRVNEQGFLTSYGKEAVQEFEKEVRSLLSCGSSVDEVRTIGSILNNLIGNQVSDRTANIELASNRTSIIIEKKAT